MQVTIQIAGAYYFKDFSLERGITFVSSPNEAANLDVEVAAGIQGLIKKTLPEVSTKILSPTSGDKNSEIIQIVYHDKIVTISK